jgi:hypothetical protein
MGFAILTAFAADKLPRFTKSGALAGVSARAVSTGGGAAAFDFAAISVFTLASAVFASLLEASRSTAFDNRQPLCQGRPVLHGAIRD